MNYYQFAQTTERKLLNIYNLVYVVIQFGPICIKIDGKQFFKTEITYNYMNFFIPIENLEHETTA
jgi:hypothetical protein